jgi:hypothetical protein
MLFVIGYIQSVRRMPYQATIEVFREFNIGGQVINILKYADDLALLAKEGTVLQGMI